MSNRKIAKMSWLKFFSALALFFGCIGLAFAETTGGTGTTATIGEVAGTVTGSFTNVGKLMVGVAYLAGFGFSIAAIFKFKQHKDNPTQIPIGTPIFLLVIGIALIFLPAVIKVGGGTAGLKEGGGFTGEGATKISAP